VSWARAARGAADCGLATKKKARIFTGLICLANGSNSFVRARRISLVSAVVAPISDVSLDAADHGVECERHPGIRAMALALDWPSLGSASEMGDAARIRLRRNRCRHSGYATKQSTALTLPGGAVTVKPSTGPSLYGSAIVSSSSNWPKH